MKFVVFGLGIVLGVLGILAYQHPDKIANQARGAVNVAEAKVQAAKFKQCRDDFLEESHCFQSNATADECFEAIEARCGRAK